MEVRKHDHGMLGERYLRERERLWTAAITPQHAASCQVAKSTYVCGHKTFTQLNDSSAGVRMM